VVTQQNLSHHFIETERKKLIIETERKKLRHDPAYTPLAVNLRLESLIRHLRNQTGKTN